MDNNMGNIEFFMPQHLKRNADFTLKDILDSGLLKQADESPDRSAATWWKGKPALLYKCDVNQCYSPKILTRIGGNYLFIDEQGDDDSCYIQAASGGIYCLTIVYLEF